jgi:hypothetical protein
VRNLAWPSAPRALGGRCRRLREELLDEALLALRRQRLADDAARGPQRKVADLRTELVDRTLLLGLDLAGRAFTQPFELGLGRRNVGVASVLGDLLGARQDVVRLASGFLEGGDALRFRALAVATCLFGVPQPLLDPRSALVEDLPQRCQREGREQDEQHDEVERRDDDPEEVDLQTGGLLRSERDCAAHGDTADRKQVHGWVCCLENDRENGDDDGEHAEAFGERRAEDELRANRRRGVRVAPDRLRGETGQDPDADARSDDPEGRKTCADVFHCVTFLLRAPSECPDAHSIV